MTWHDVGWLVVGMGLGFWFDDNWMAWRKRRGLDHPETPPTRGGS